MSRARSQSVRQLVAPLSSRQEHGAVLISVTGALNAGLFSRLGAQLRQAPIGQPVIVNLSALTLDSARVLEQLVVFLRSYSDSHVCVVCGRLSARKLLRCAGVADIIPVFMTTADAVQALVLHADGYGPGWSVASASASATSPSTTGGEALVGG